MISYCIEQNILHIWFGQTDLYIIYISKCTFFSVSSYQSNYRNLNNPQTQMHISSGNHPTSPPHSSQHSGEHFPTRFSQSFSPTPFYSTCHNLPSTSLFNNSPPFSSHHIPIKHFSTTLFTTIININFWQTFTRHQHCQKKTPPHNKTTITTTKTFKLPQEKSYHQKTYQHTPIKTIPHHKNNKLLLQKYLPTTKD